MMEFNYPVISNNYITENYHSGVYCYEAAPTIRNNIISGNTGFFSGGICCYSNSSPVITGNTITGNRAEDSGGIGCDSGSSVTVSNCIIWGNIADANDIQISVIYDKYLPSSTSLTISYSDIEYGQNAIYLGDPNYCTLNWGLGNISKEPLFATRGFWDESDFWAEGNYHILPGSPCIDTGDPDYIADSDDFDIDGNVRIVGDQMDIGADEYIIGEYADLNNDGITNLGDFAILATYWLENEPSVDIAPPDGDGVIDIQDLMEFIWHWLDQANRDSCKRRSKSTAVLE